MTNKGKREPSIQQQSEKVWGSRFELWLANHPCL